MAKVLSVKSNFGKLGWKFRRYEDENTGVVKYGAALVPFSTITEREINKWAAEFMKVSEAQMKAAFQALTDAIQYFVMNGHSVTLGELGNFSFSTKSGVWDEKTKKWKSAGKTVIGDVSADAIRACYVRFRPSTELRRRLGGASMFCVEDTAYGLTVVQ